MSLFRFSLCLALKSKVKIRPVGRIFTLRLSVERNEMKLGEIKLQAIRLGFPDFFISCDEEDDQSLIDTVASLKQDPNFSGFLESAVGAINRGLAYIESRGLSPSGCVDYPLSLCQKGKDGGVKIPLPSDCLAVERVVLIQGDKRYFLGFEVQGNELLTEERQGTYTVVYKTKIPRVFSTTRDSYILELPEGLGDALPYFVASDILGVDKESASGLRQYFEEITDYMSKKISPCYTCLETRYSME